MKAYNILKRWESILLVTFNIFSCIKNQFTFKNLDYLKKNRCLKNTSKKDSCYILMGGLSVKNINLEDLYGSDVITANNYFKTDDYIKIKPKYHVITDVDFYLNSKNVDELSNKICDFTTVILNGKHTVPITKKNWHYIYPAYRVVNARIKTDLSKPCSNFSTVTLTCIQLAIYLGYKTINLVGFDLPPGNMPHYYKESEYEVAAQKQNTNKIEEFEYCELFWQYTNCQHETYKIIEYANKNNIQIFNTSTISYVRAFPFKNIENT